MPADIPCFFVSDLHGKMSRYDSLIKAVANEKPSIVFIGGDLLPHLRMNADNFVKEYIPGKLRKLKELLGQDYPLIVMIPGNDDPAIFIDDFLDIEKKGLWTYLHMNCINFFNFSIYGYAIVPPTPFQNKDWEKYDISRFIDPGSIAPDEGFRTVEPDFDIEYSTIQKDLITLTGSNDLSSSVFLFHSPPYDSNLDRAVLDGMYFDNVPLDIHVGSIAIKRFIEEKQPLISLHGHIHESTRLTGIWKENFGKTVAVNSSHDGPELCLIRFNLNDPGNATRELLG